MSIRDRLALTIDSTPEEIKNFFERENSQLESELPKSVEIKKQLDDEELKKYVEEFSPYPFFLYAYTHGASDIDFTAYPSDSSEKEGHVPDDRTRVRYKIDGYWFDVFTFDRELHNQYINAIKNWAIKGSGNAKTENQRISQDGKGIFHVINKNKEIEKTIQLRLAFIPQHVGDSKSTPLECCVIRLLDSQGNPDLEHAGFNRFDYQKLMKLPTMKKGLVLISGPTGSGKSSTLFGYIDKINDRTKNIYTLENPVEFDVPGIKQIDVQPQENIPDDDEVTLNFTRSEQFLMRGAPDVILVGEIRSFQTAKTAITLANTGHITLGTLHTNSAMATLDRLNGFRSKTGDMLDKFSLIDSLEYVSAQMLSPKLCKHCKITIKQVREMVTEQTKELTEKYSKIVKDRYLQQGVQKQVTQTDILDEFEREKPDEKYVYDEYLSMLKDVDIQTTLVIQEMSRFNIKKILGSKTVSEENLKKYIEESYLPNLYGCPKCTQKEKGKKPLDSVGMKGRVMINETIFFDNYIKKKFLSGEMSNSEIQATLLDIRPRLPNSNKDAIVNEEQHFCTLYQDALFKAILPPQIAQVIIPQYKETNESQTISILDAKKNGYKEI